MFKKIIYFILFAVLIFIILFFMLIHPVTQVANKEITNLPYKNEIVSIGIICEKYIFYLNLNFTIQKSDLLCYKYNDSKILDSFISYSKEIYNQDISKTVKIDFKALEKTVNSLGGINTVDKDGNNIHLHGYNVTDILNSESDKLYISYIFGDIIKSIIKQQHFSCIYEYSDISFIDINSQYSLIMQTIERIDCIN